MNIYKWMMVFYVYAGIFLEAAEKAICNLQSGKRVTLISYGDTQVQYAPINLADLLKLRSQIKVCLAEATPRKHQRGFDDKNR